jgi:NADPH-dependent F420 reductase
MPGNLPTLAILGGTGKEGNGLASRWAFAGYSIIIGSRQVEKAKKTADNINNRLSISHVIGLANRDAAKLAEICVLTVVHTVHEEVLESLKDDLQGKILVDATSQFNFLDPRPPEPPSAAQQAQKLLGPSVRVVAAFQNIPAKSLVKEIDHPIDADVLVCSDDIQAAQQVILLAKTAGMRGYYAGNLANAIIVEGITSILISLNKHYGVKNASIIITGIPDQK